ncbi:hypothetical protein GCM10022280_10030 [Sphingomonas swuensis]|uniref:Peptidase M48 domain-containing protein n=1 Tax=Sphingomonas swuensis TaxID=977800 RepID=A0ABP7SMA2_9SPHN
MVSCSLRLDSSADHWNSGFRIDSRYHPLVARLTRSAERDAASYRRRVILAALLGYVVVGALIGLLLAVVVGSAWSLFGSSSGAYVKVKLGLVAGALAFAILRSMIVRDDGPSGVLLQRDDAPELFALIDEVRLQLGGFPLHAVYVSDDLNASMAQPARWWIFGTRNILTLGIPLLSSVDPAELRAIIAHEFGHSVGGHGRWAAFVYKVRMRWMQMAERLQSGFAAALLGRFFRWYGPWFNAYSFVLARQQEYEADRVAASVTSPATAGHALLRIEAAADHYSDHWERLWSEARTSAEPSALPFRSFRPHSSGDPSSAEQAIRRALRRPTGLDDTHPSLSDRLAALGVAADAPLPETAGSALDLLGPAADALLDHYDRMWWDNAHPSWTAFHADLPALLEERHRLTALVDTGEASPPDCDALVEVAEQVGGTEGGIDARRSILRAFPGAVPNRFHLGMILLGRDDPEGVALTEQAIAEWPGLGEVGYGALADFAALNDEAAVERYRALGAQAVEQEKRSSGEFNKLGRGDHFAPLSLSPPDLARLVAAASAVEGVKTLVAGERRLQSDGRCQRVFVFEARRGHDSNALLDALMPLFLPHGDVAGMEKGLRNRWLHRRLRALDGGRLIGD